MENEGKRLNKYISDAGIASRREADKLIEEGKVEIRRKSRKDEPEKPAVRASVGDRVYNGDTVYVEGNELPKKEVSKVYYMYNKPCGVVCTLNRSIEGNLADEVDIDRYVSYAGRLDKDSSGLLILTNDGALSDKIMRASSHHEKEYIVAVSAPVTNEFIKKMSEGVKIHLDDDETLRKHPEGQWVTTRPCKVKKVAERRFSIVLTQGFNRQIRRMCRALGFSVSSIQRVRIMNLRLGELKVGATRQLTEEELTQLMAMADGKSARAAAGKPQRKSSWAVAKKDRSDMKPRHHYDASKKSDAKTTGRTKPTAKNAGGRPKSSGRPSRPQTGRSDNRGRR